MPFLEELEAPTIKLFSVFSLHTVTFFPIYHTIENIFSGNYWHRFRIVNRITDVIGVAWCVEIGTGSSNIFIH